MALCRAETLRRRRSNQRRRLILEAGSTATAPTLDFSGDDSATYAQETFPTDRPGNNIDLPANAFEPGDGILVIATSDITGASPFSAIQDDIDGTTGWIEHARMGNTQTDCNIVVWTKTATGGEATITLSHLDQVSMDVVINCTRIPAAGWDPDGIVVGTQYEATAGGTSDTIPGLTPAGNNSNVICIITQDGYGASPFSTANGEWTKVLDDFPPGLTNTGYGCATAVFQRNPSSADPTGDLIIGSSDFDFACGVMLSFTNTNL